MSKRNIAIVALLSALVSLAGCAAPGEFQEDVDTPTASTDASAKADDSGGKTDAESESDKGTTVTKDDGKEDDGDEAAKKAKEKAEKEKKEKEAKQKKWDETIDELQRIEGFFTVWYGKDDNKLLLELDDASFGREFVYGGGLGSGAGSGSLYRGAMLSDNEFVLRFEKRNGKHAVIVAENNRYLEAGDSLEKKMLDEVTSESVLQDFEFVAEHEDDGKFLVDIGSWLLGDNLEIARAAGSKYKANKTLSAITSVGVYPRNVEIGIDMQLTGSRGGGNLTIADGRGLRVKIHHWLAGLPPDGYKPRVLDQRVGYFYTERKDLFDYESADPVTRYVNRWRLQKKDPTAEVSDPVKPIVFWIENSTPKKWRDAVRKGIEMWEPAFRKAGFSNAIVAKQMPEDADWDPADVRYSVVRWSADEGVSFAIGPSRANPRTGEIFDADITMQAGFLNTYRERFEKWVSDIANTPKEQVLEEIEARVATTVPEDFDPKGMCSLASERVQHAAQAMTISSILNEDFDADAFLAQMLAEVVAHEVGHTIGLRHNFKSSIWLDADKINDVSFTAARGMVGSVMDYNAINLAGPGKTQGEFFATAVGPYDIWAVEYGYSEFGSNEQAGIKAIASRSHEAGLDYGTDEDYFMGDPWTVTWDMTSDPIGFSAEQIALAEKGFTLLAERGAEDGEGYDRYSRFYAMMASLYARNYSSLDRFFWGVGMNRDVVGQQDGRPPIELVPPAEQRRALDLMVEKGLKWTGGIPDEQRLLLANRKFGPFGEWFDIWQFDPLPRVVNGTRYGVLASLMNRSMLERLQGTATFAGADAVTPAEITDRAFDTVWASNTPDEHDRWTQDDFLELTFRGLKYEVNPDITALFDSLLRRVDARAQQYAGSGDATVAAHGAWLAGRIERYNNRTIVEDW